MKAITSHGKKQRGDKKQIKTRDGKPRRDKRTPLFEDYDNIIKEQQQKNNSKNKKKRVANSIAIGDGNDKRQKQEPHEVINRNDNSESSSENHSDEYNESNEEDEGVDEESNEESENDNKEIEEEVENSESGNSDSESSSKKKNSKNKSNGKHSIVTPNMKSLLQWYARNPLFKKVKVLDESHLDAKGNIMQEALDRLKIDKTSKNVNAYINEFRQIIKRSISSRRGYVKRIIGAKLISLFKSNHLSFEMLASINNFYKEGFEQDKNVRSFWYLFCFHLLPVINKDWKDCLQGSRVLKTTFLYEHISTSDEAMVLWMIKNWEPKIKDQAEKGWPGLTNTTADGEQELRAGLKEYIGYHTLISAFKSKENGELACRWSDIFWEEMVTNNPNIYKKRNLEVSNPLLATDQEGFEDAVVLPGIDEDNNALIGCFSKRKSFKKKYPSSDSLTNNKEGDNVLVNQDLENTDSQQSHHSNIGLLVENTESVNPNTDNLPGIFLNEIKNKTQI